MLPTAKTENYNATSGLDEGLVGYWTFDGPDIDLDNNIIYDRSGNYNNGTASGSPKVAIGKHGQALEFDGVDDFIDIEGDFPTGNSERTINFWFNTDSFHVAEFDCFFAYDASGDNGKNMDICAQNNAVSVSFYGHDVITPKDELETGVWYNVSVVVPTGASTTDEVLVYIDGVLQILSDEGGSPRTLNTNFPNIQLGDRNTDAQDYDGKLDEFRFYNRALSASEIKALYNKNKTQYQSSQKEYHKQGLVGYWSFDGADVDWASPSAEILDRSGNGNHGDALGGVSATIGKIGQALDFDGSNDYVLVADNPALRISDELTISAWIKYDGLNPGYKYIVEKGYQDSDNYGFFLSDNILNFEFYDGAWRHYASTDTVPLNEWIHVLVTYHDSNNELRFFVNGTEDSGGPVSTSYSISDAITHDLVIGRQNDSINSNPTSAFFPGSIDEVRIYNYALSDQEITALYNSGKVEMNH